MPGYAVDCDPNSEEDEPVCILEDDWNCSLSGHYIREAVCASVHGGTPLDYDGKPKIVDVNGVSSLDCAYRPTGVLNGDVNPSRECTMDAMCGLQIGGYQYWAPIQEPDGWDELDGCESEEPTGGPVEGTGIWVCNGSPTIDGRIVDGIPPVSVNTPIFMSGNIPDCVYATDVSDAKDACYALCTCKDDYWEEQAVKNELFWQNFPCGELYSFNPPPAEVEDPNTMCSDGIVMMPNDVTCPEQFSGTAELTIFPVGTATSSDLGGFMDFTIDTCSGSGPCDVSVTQIHIWTSTIRGEYTYQGSGPPVSLPFIIEDLQVRLLQPVLGELSPSTGLVTFPGEDLFATVSTGETSLNGTPLNAGLDNVLFVIEGATGSWDGQHLTLDLNWATATGSLQLSLELTSR